MKHKTTKRYLPCHTVWLIAFSMLLTACAHHDALKKEKIAELQSLAIRIELPPDRMDTQITDPMLPGQKELPVFLQNLIARLRHSEKKALVQEPIRRIVYGYDFPAFLQQATKKVFSEPENQIRNISIGISENTEQAVRHSEFLAAGEDAVLFINLEYKLIEKRLFVSASSRMYPRAESMRLVSGPPIYDDLDGKNILYTSNHILSEADISPENIIPVLEETTQKILGMIAGDILDPA